MIHREHKFAYDAQAHVSYIINPKPPSTWYDDVILFMDRYFIGGLILGAVGACTYNVIAACYYDSNHHNMHFQDILNGHRQRFNMPDQLQNPLISIQPLIEPLFDAYVADSDDECVPYSTKPVAMIKGEAVLRKIVSTSQGAEKMIHNLHIHGERINTKMIKESPQAWRDAIRTLQEVEDRYIADSKQWNEVQVSLGSWYRYPHESSQIFGERLANKGLINEHLVANYRHLLWTQTSIEIIQQTLKDSSHE